VDESGLWATGRIGGGACGLAAEPALDLMEEARL
jgi:hypothetical protein